MTKTTEQPSGSKLLHKLAHSRREAESLREQLAAAQAVIARWVKLAQSLDVGNDCDDSCIRVLCDESANHGDALTAHDREKDKRIAGLEKALVEASSKSPRMIEIMLKHGYKFERFPRDMEKEPPTTDGERWEALAFSLYSELAEVSFNALALLVGKGGE